MIYKPLHILLYNWCCTACCIDICFCTQCSIVDLECFDTCYHTLSHTFVCSWSEINQLYQVWFKTMHEVLTWHSILDLVSQEPTGTNLQPHPHENAFKIKSLKIVVKSFLLTSIASLMIWKVNTWFGKNMAISSKPCT